MDDLSKLLTALDLTNQESLSPCFSFPAEIDSLLKSASFRDLFSKFVDNGDRVRSIFAQKKIYDFIEKLAKQCNTTHVGKDLTKASKYRTDGNRAFGIGKYKLAISLYSQAVQYAPNTVLDAGHEPKSATDGQLSRAGTTEELSLAFGNRSAAYFRLSQYENAVKDIDAALHFGYEQYKPALKLQMRKSECLVNLKRWTEAKEILKFIKPPDNSPDYGGWVELSGLVNEAIEAFKEINDNFNGYSMKDQYAFLEYLKSINRFVSQPKFPTINTNVAIRYDPEKGYHFVANKTIRSGEVLALSEPYAFVLNKDQDGRYCHHCLVQLGASTKTCVTDVGIESSMLREFPRSIPCCQCTTVLYCSEQCCSDSWNTYHRFECSILPLLHNCQSFHLALRTLFTAGGLDSIRNVSEKMKNLQKSPFELTGPVTYEHVYAMKLHSNVAPELSVEDLIKCTIAACLMVKLVKKCYDSKDSNLMKTWTKDDGVFCASILLRHLIQLKANITILVKTKISHASDEPNVMEISNLEDIRTVDPIISMVTQSCDPNVAINPVDGDGNTSNVHMLMAVRSIPIGTKICAHFPRYGCGQSMKLRFVTAALKKDRIKKRVKCLCEKCEQDRRDNPFGDDITDYDTIYSAKYYTHEIGCSKCGGLVTRSAVADPFRCTDCRQQVSLQEMKTTYENLGTLVVEAFEKLHYAESSEDYQQLKQVESFVDKKIVPLLHCGSICLADIYERLMAIYRGHFANSNDYGKKFCKAWDYAKKDLAVLERQFGEDSLIVLDHLFNLTMWFGPYFLKPNFLSRVQNSRELLRSYKSIQSRFDKLKVVFSLSGKSSYICVKSSF